MSRMTDRKMWNAYQAVEADGHATERQLHSQMGRQFSLERIADHLRDMESRGCAERLRPNGDGTMMWHVYRPLDLVPVEPFQRRFLELHAAGECGTNEVARALGWTRDNKGDARRLLRKLGLADHISTRTRDGQRIVDHYRQHHLPYEVAVALCRALHMDPVDCGV